MGWSSCGELDPWDIDKKKAKEIVRMFLDKKDTLVKKSQRRERSKEEGKTEI